MSINLRVKSEEEMEYLGSLLGSLLEAGDLVYLSGELGAGKTTFTRGVARGLAYPGRVNSPTFTIMNIYQAVLPIYHFDFYRLGEGDLVDLGLEDYLGREGICVVEWPQAGEQVLPGSAVYVNIVLEDDDYDRPRKVIVRGEGARFHEIVERLKEFVASCN
ncbi:MAG TPA: tRNA (adenosine(37)-N6)-threonylcarbamoyltransferase complex ATPase subunit type 1 TsaE [Syntrophomonadaceae bacterium]|nr:tRNA (adenosine(37)-N6)-threonylcarbamoyltransferase complex ATPase subunit type 1 TsaE [Syntrophomonadaceae bacterium]